LKLSKLKRGLFVTLLLACFFCLSPKLAYPGTIIPLDRKNFIEERFYSGLKACEPNRVASPDGIIGGIVPHHLLAADIIADFFQRISLTADPDTIILIGPNHREIGRSPILSSQADWTTPFGITYCDRAVVKKLVTGGILSLDDIILSDEHSVSIIIPFIKKYFVRAKIVPIIISASLSRQRAMELGGVLSGYLGPRTLLVASLDFSHYLSSQQAELNDRETIRSIYERGYEHIFDYGNDHVDSPNVLLAILRAMETKKANTVSISQHSNSGIMFDRNVDNSTSYFSILFSRPDQNEPLKLSFCGDIMLARDVGQAMLRNGAEHPFLEAKHIFEGSDLVFGNLESILSKDLFKYDPGLRFKANRSSLDGLKSAGFNYLSVINNHNLDYGRREWEESNALLVGAGITPVNSDEPAIYSHKKSKISLLAFDLTRRGFNADDALRKIRGSKLISGLSIVSVHWGEEYQGKQNNVQNMIARKFVDAGADIIIGHHPHVVQGIEKYKWGLIFYSLGNFVFDQYQSSAVKQGLTIRLNYQDGRVNHIDLIPVKIYNNLPRFAEPGVRKAILERIADNSTPSLKAQIIGGMIDNRTD